MEVALTENVFVLKDLGYLIYKYRDNIKVYIDRGRTWLIGSGRNDSPEFAENPHDNISGVLGENSKQS